MSVCEQVNWRGAALADCTVGPHQLSQASFKIRNPFALHFTATRLPLARQSQASTAPLPGGAPRRAGRQATTTTPARGRRRQKEGRNSGKVEDGQESTPHKERAARQQESQQVIDKYCKPIRERERERERETERERERQVSEAAEKFGTGGLSVGGAFSCTWIWSLSSFQTLLAPFAAFLPIARFRAQKRLQQNDVPLATTHLFRITLLLL